MYKVQHCNDSTSYLKNLRCGFSVCSNILYFIFLRVLYIYIYTILGGGGGRKICKLLKLILNKDL